MATGETKGVTWWPTEVKWPRKGQAERDDALASALILLDHNINYEVASGQWKRTKDNPDDKETLEFYRCHVKRLREAVLASGFELMLYDRR